MEPFTALSLAASIAQFLVRGGNLIKQSRNIAKAGSCLGIDELKSTTEDLLNATENLKSPLKDTDGTSSREEQVETLDITNCLKHVQAHTD